LKFWKKRVHGAVAFIPNHSSNDGIDVIFTHVIVVPFVGTNGLALYSVLNVHLSAHHISDNVIVYVHAVEYVCVFVEDALVVELPSHRLIV
jgi:hypothetical protein